MAFNWGGAVGGGAAGGEAGNAFNSLFPDPSKNAMKYLDQIPESIRPYFQQYFQTGQNQLPQLSNTGGSLINNTGDVYNRLGAGYKESPGYKWNLDQGEKAINNAYAAGGMAGSNAHGQDAGQLASHLADQDFQDYIKNNMDLFKTGINTSENLAKGGQTAGSSFADQIAQALSAKSGLTYAGGANQNNEKSSFLNSLIQAISTLAK